MHLFPSRPVEFKKSLWRPEGLRVGSQPEQIENVGMHGFQYKTSTFFADQAYN